MVRPYILFDVHLTLSSQVVIPDANIKNFTTDWNNGRALAALVDTCVPGSIPHWNSLDENTAVRNITNAMQVRGYLVSMLSLCCIYYDVYII